MQLAIEAAHLKAIARYRSLAETRSYQLNIRGEPLHVESGYAFSGNEVPAARPEGKDDDDQPTEEIPEWLRDAIEHPPEVAESDSAEHGYSALSEAGWAALGLGTLALKNIRGPEEIARELYEWRRLHGGK